MVLSNSNILILCFLCCIITNLIIYLYLKLPLIIRIWVIILVDFMYIYSFLFLETSKLTNFIIYFLIILNILIVPIIIIFNNYSFNNSTNYGWKKYSKFPVLGNLKTGSFFDPYVIKINDEYFMYFSNRKEWTICVSKSLDGINRDSPIPVLKSSGNGDWENVINRACILYKDSKFLMRYTGQFWGKSRIWYAESDDWIIFKKFNKNPVLVPELNFEWESIMNPNVIYDKKSGTFKMYYAAGEQYEPDCIWYAESNDGIHWGKRNTPVLGKSKNLNSYDYFKVWATDVHIMDNWKYIMFYIWYTDINTGRIMFATSNDGISWKKNGNYLVASSKFWFDGDSVYKPSVLYNKKENKWMMRYNGRLNDREYIGYAECSNQTFNEKIQYK